MPRYVSRDGTGRINGTFNKPQPGMPVEQLPDDDPDLVAFEANGLALTAAELDAQKDERVVSLQSGPLKAVLSALFQINNRMRVLEGQQALTAAQFRSFVKGLM